jgi:two-component system OmpR family response regulator
MYRILIADCDRIAGDRLKRYLHTEGFLVEVARDGRASLGAARQQPFGAVILNAILPDVHALDVLRQLRKTSNVPVLILSARCEEVDRIVALESGADDYIEKTCHPRELVARIRAVLRRTHPEHPESAEELLPEVIRVGDVELRCGERTVLCRNRLVNSTTAEFDLLETLLRSAGHVVEKHDLAARSLGHNPSMSDRSVDLHICHIRRKLGPGPAGTERIKTIHGRGYMYVHPNWIASTAPKALSRGMKYSNS